MKTRQDKSVEQFQKEIKIALTKYYHQALSDNAKRIWQKRKGNLSTLSKLQCKAV